MTTAASTEETMTEESASEATFASPLIAKSLEKSKLFAAKSLFTAKKSSKFMWHAWLGSAATAEENVVSLAKAMAVKGLEVESKAKAEMAEKVGKVKTTSIKTKAKLTGLSKDKMETVEKFINKGLNKSLHAVGVPTRGDMDKLALLMTDMSKSIEELTAISDGKSKRSTGKSASV